MTIGSHLRFDVVKETKETLKDSNATPSPTTEEVARAAVQGAHLSNSSSSLSDDHLSHHKAVVPGIRSSSSPPTDGLGSTACASPPNTSICVMSTSDNSNLLENNGCCSPDARLHHEKPKHAAANSSNNRGEANAALTSFEANLGTLKRTKESISRATRIAIECAKFGIAPKVHPYNLKSFWLYEELICNELNFLFQIVFYSIIFFKNYLQ